MSMPSGFSAADIRFCTADGICRRKRPNLTDYNTVLSLAAMRPLFLSVLSALLLWSATATAHTGATAVAVPVHGIAVDGDFSDWPEEMQR